MMELEEIEQLFSRSLYEMVRKLYSVRDKEKGETTSKGLRLLTNFPRYLMNQKT